MTVRRGFTLIELLVVVVIAGVLAAMLVPAVLGSLRLAEETACASNLRQLGFAVRMYLNDNNGLFFPIRETMPGGVSWYFGFEASDSRSQGEGQRVLDRTRGKLYPYLKSSEGVEICPAFRYDGPYKAKYQGKWWTYGVNAELAGLPTCRSLSEIRGSDAGRTVLFADAAWINTFQAPASPQNPLVEEWFYIQPGVRYVHFRHGGRANVLFADWHVEALGPAPGSLDPRLPHARVGFLDPKAVLFRPRGAR
jgi:prepilin-type N-terminal cleavage/methylation domain-containing protein/prepilin-type processing-associated H-X9-DG protein